MTFDRAITYKYAVGKLLCEIESYVQDGEFDDARVEIARLRRVADNMETDGWEKAATWVRSQVRQMSKGTAS